jgi:hypothetical protein
VNPPFGLSARLADTPQVGMTSVWLLDTQPDRHGVLLRFLDFALKLPATDNQPEDETSVVPCKVEAHHNDSTLTIVFPDFGNGTLSYDPGTSRLLHCCFCHALQC